MATSKSKLEKSLKSRNEVRIEHLLKLYFYPEDKRDREGWKWSVYNSLRSVPLLKNGRYPDYQFLYEQIWVKPYEGRLDREMEQRVLFISRRMHAFRPPQFPLDVAVIKNCYDICEEYSRWLADWLSNAGEHSWVTAFSQIELVLKKSIYVK
jgi:hypothetical protein